MNPHKHHLIASCLLAAAWTLAALCELGLGHGLAEDHQLQQDGEPTEAADADLRRRQHVLKALSWSSFGGATAQAKGTFVIDLCKPNCAAGKDASYPVSVKADELEEMQRRDACTRT